MIALEHLAAPKPLHIHFARMATSIGRSNVPFITDASRSWMNVPELADAIQRIVEETAEQVAAGDIVAIGNAMGGSEANMLANVTPVNRVLAIVPQYSVRPDMMSEEPRWTFLRDRIVEWPYPKVPDLRDRECVVTLLHGGMQDEWMHASRFPEDAGYRHYLFPERRHTLARSLHKQGLLRPIVQAIIEGRPSGAQKAIEAAGGMLRAEFEAAGLTLSPKEAGHDEI